MNQYLKNKKGLQMSFQWIFAIIVGAIILSLTIYGVTKYMNIEQGSQDVQKARQIEALLNPTETSFESAGTIPFETSVRTRIKTDCNVYGEFGEQRISVKQENFDKTSSVDNSVISKNRYIFSDNYVESENYFYIFTKPFEIPFKVADLNYLTSAEKIYCFQNPPEKIEGELTKLNQTNLKVNCEDEVSGYENSVEICFERGNIRVSSSCDAIVKYNEGVIEKQDKELYFYNDALMYAGIFSSVENYECQLKRLMKRTGKLSKIYIEKNNIVSSTCESNMVSELAALRNFARNYNESADMNSNLLNQMVNRLEDKNDVKWGCELW